jgi:ketosteroid isomerase-like protein
VNIWNHQDAKAFASLLTEDCKWRDEMEQSMIGRKEVEHMHVYPFTTA